MDKILFVLLFGVIGVDDFGERKSQFRDTESLNFWILFRQSVRWANKEWKDKEGSTTTSKNGCEFEKQRFGLKVRFSSLEEIDTWKVKGALASSFSNTYSQSQTDFLSKDKLWHTDIDFGTVFTIWAVFY